MPLINLKKLTQKGKLSLPPYFNSNYIELKHPR